MKKRQIKKRVLLLSDADLLEHVGYTRNKRLRLFAEKEFDKRFKEAMEFEEKLAEDLMVVSSEVDEILKEGMDS